MTMTSVDENVQTLECPPPFPGCRVALPLRKTAPSEGLRRPGLRRERPSRGLRAPPTGSCRWCGVAFPGMATLVISLEMIKYLITLVFFF